MSKKVEVKFSEIEIGEEFSVVVAIRKKRFSGSQRQHYTKAKRSIRDCRPKNCIRFDSGKKSFIRDSAIVTAKR